MAGWAINSGKQAWLTEELFQKWDGFTPQKLTWNLKLVMVWVDMSCFFSFFFWGGATNVFLRFQSLIILGIPFEAVGDTIFSQPDRTSAIPGKHQSPLQRTWSWVVQSLGFFVQTTTLISPSQQFVGPMVFTTLNVGYDTRNGHLASDCKDCLGVGFKHLFMFTPTWEKISILTSTFFKWVETTN